MGSRAKCLCGRREEGKKRERESVENNALPILLKFYSYFYVIKYYDIHKVLGVFGFFFFFLKQEGIIHPFSLLRRLKEGFSCTLTKPVHTTNWYLDFFLQVDKIKLEFFVSTFNDIIHKYGST